MKSLPSSYAYARWLAVIRFLTGGLWLTFAIPKFTQSDEFMPPTGLIAVYVSRGLASTNPADPYHGFLANVVQPNITIFAELVRLGELVVGLSLLLGVLTRLGGIGGVLLTLNYMAARGGLLAFRAWASVDAAMMVLSLISVVLPTGRVWGIDSFFAKKIEPPAPVRAEFVDETPPSPAPPPPTEVA